MLRYARPSHPRLRRFCRAGQVYLAENMDGLPAGRQAAVKVFQDTPGAQYTLRSELAAARILLESPCSSIVPLLGTVRS